MKNHRFHLMTRLFVVFAGLVFIGCASTPPTRFYVLSPLSGSGKVGGEPCVSIDAGPVKIPEYLDRSGIVTRITPNELRVSEFHKWGESLEFNVPRVLAENLASLICTKAIITPPARGGGAVDYRVYVDVIRMDGILGEDAILDVSWTLIDGADKKNVYVTKRASYKEVTQGQDYEAFVSAQSRNVGALSQDIAEAIKRLAEKPRQ